ncbi:hypothetical protein [Sphingomonas qomolangmaensis]|uniref:Glycerophosphoryl diester phosphodiesterase membrane domain-containing protein n=1 Tax=Sphingomonas qomolangmaensis TaxID=2918765 RepID=A0ABY5LAF2_9SPHN|nr:hypothetical protein [Sphingomonas qomolangmaensis]UUL83949.1 hypothetical protein NMP03_07085 [Sphingomonas qomolangmaensis]
MFTIIILAFLLLAAALAVAIGMAMRNAANRGWSFELSRVIGDAFGAIAQAPLLFAVTVLVSGAAPMVAALLLIRVSDVSQVPSFFSAMLVGLAALAIGQLGNLLLVAATLDLLDRQPIDLPRLFARVLPRIPSAVLLLILFWFAIGIGFVFFIIPALVLICLWFVVTPAMVAERLGAFASFARSADLTAGARWQLLLLLVIGAIFWVVAQAMIGGIAAITGDGQTASVLYTVLTALLGMIPPAVVASAYHTLRTQKEGLRGDDLEQVFA